MKTETKHTPGEWSVHRNLQTAVSPNSGWEVWTDGRRQQRICTLLDCENAEGNARLIASAPQLLEALQDALAFVIDGQLVSHQRSPSNPRQVSRVSVATAIRDTIAKAVNP